MRKKKYLLIVLLLLAVVAAGVSILGYIKKEQKKVTAQEWIANQYHLIDEFNTFSSTLDDVITVYTIGSMDTSDLVNELEIAGTELEIMKLAYDQDLEEHPIKTGTHTYETKAGKEGIEKIWDSYQALVAQMEESCANGGSANEIAYTYLAYREPIADGLFDYIYAYYSITDPSKLESLWETEELQESEASTERITEQIVEEITEGGEANAD